jgi:murein DD-endopeptidase MepM/ murein hydrolase activator NlpD
MYPTKYDTPLTGLDWLEYYSKHNVYHPGIDFNKGYGDQDCGQEIVCPKSGVVEFFWDSIWNTGGFGRFVIIRHNDGMYTRYAHLRSIDPIIKDGARIKEDDLIGFLGKTGTTYCHLHFEVFNEKCANWQRKHWRAWRAYPSGWAKHSIQDYYLNPWEWLKEKKYKTLSLFEMITKLQRAGLMDESININSKVSVRDMRKYLDYFLT